MNNSLLPKVSVVVTCYNYGQYVAQALDSVQRQTFTNFEVIVVDDGSTDDSETQVLPFLEDSRFCYIKQQNGGQANAKNRGIKESRGELIAFLDADDIWDAGKLEKQLVLFDNPNVGVVYSRADLIDAGGRKRVCTFQGGYLRPRKGNVTNWLFLDNFVWFSSSIVRKECFELFHGFNESLEMGIDWDLWLRISTMYEFDYVSEPLLLYRVGHSDQMSKNIEMRYCCSDRIMKSFLKKFPRVIEKKYIRKAYSITYCNRGDFYWDTDRYKSIIFFLRSIFIHPTNLYACKNILKKVFCK